MDFRSRGVQTPQTSSASSASGNSSNNGNSSFRSVGSSKWLPIASVVLLIGVTIMLVALSFFAYLGGPSQAKAVKKDNYQAVFLNNGQVYFGNIKELNNKYVSLANIYYLQTNNTDGTTQSTASAAGNVSLVKLGCELHSPFDQMLINSDQVIFWENLQDSGQVVKAIAQYKKDNPKGQTCSTSSSNSTQQAPATSTQPTTTTPTTTKKP